MSTESRPIRLSPIGKLITIATISAVAILLISALGNVLSPFIAAAITAYLFNPLIGWAHRRTRVSRAVWIIVLYVLIGALIYALLRFLVPLIAGQYNELINQIPNIASDLAALFAANQSLDIAGLKIDIGGLEQPVLDFVKTIGLSLPETVPHLFLSAIESVLLFVTYLIVTFYFLLQAEQITDRAFCLVPAVYREEIRALGRQIDTILASYIRGTLILIPIMSILTFIALQFLGIRYALVIAIASGFLEIIPLIGPWSAASIAMLVALFQATAPFGWSHGLLALVVGTTYFVLRMFEDNFIIPHVMGHAVHLHPVLVLFAILAGGALGGAFGLLVSIPVVAIIQLLLRYLYRKLVDEPGVPPPDVMPPPAARPSRTTEPIPSRATRPLSSTEDRATHP